MSSPSSDSLSPSSGEATPELDDATEFLEDDTEAGGERLHTFISRFTPRWTQPWSKDTEISTSPKRPERSPEQSPERSPPWDYGPSGGPERSPERSPPWDYGPSGGPERSPERSPRLDYGPSGGPAQNTEGVETNLSRSTWSFQYNTKRSLVGAGMENLGNTCFLNSVLQCFIHTVPILRGILSDGNLRHSNCNKEDFCLLCALGELIVCSLTNSIVSPHNMADNLSYISSSFKRFHQEDAHEFLQGFLDRLENLYDSESKGCTSLPSDNLVKQVFGGRVVSSLKCCNCGHRSDSYEPSVDLSLEIEDAENLLIALQSFTKVERIEDPDTKFTCEKCKEQVSVEKKLSFDQTPSVAVFHLKRFKNDGCVVQKIDKHVPFPLDLDLLPFTGNNEKSETELKYVLYAVVVHIGLTSTSGHYYCFIRLSPYIWCKFDDSKVVLVSEDFVLSQNAYILFYAKESTPWFLSFIESQKEFVHSFIWNASPKSVLDNLDTSPVSHSLDNKSGLNPNEASPLFGSEHSKVDHNEINHSGPSPGSASERSRVDDNEIKHSAPSPSSASERSKVDDNEIKHSAPMQNKIESRGSKYIFDVSDSVALHSSRSPAVYTTTAGSVSPVIFAKAFRNQENHELPVYENDNHEALRSPSPEIYREDSPVKYAGFSIPPNHLRLAQRMSCKRRLDTGMDDPKIKQACSFIRKNMHSSRGQQLLAAISGPGNKARVNTRKSRRLGLPHNSNTRTALRSSASRTNR